MQMKMIDPELSKKFPSLFKGYTLELFYKPYGFDIVMFDKVMKVPAGISTKDHIGKGRGGRARVKLVEEILAYDLRYNLFSPFALGLNKDCSDGYYICQEIRGNLKLLEKIEPESVKFVSDNFALRTVESGYVIDHLPSGLKFTFVKTIKKAKAMIEELEEVEGIGVFPVSNDVFPQLVFIRDNT